MYVTTVLRAVSRYLAIAPGRENLCLPLRYTKAKHVCLVRRQALQLRPGQSIPHLVKGNKIFHGLTIWQRSREAEKQRSEYGSMDLLLGLPGTYSWRTRYNKRPSR